VREGPVALAEALLPDPEEFVERVLDDVLERVLG
jgi:hypothetical protein